MQPVIDAHVAICRSKGEGILIDREVFVNTTVAQMYHKCAIMKRIFPGQQLVWGKHDVHRAYNRLAYLPEASLLMTILINPTTVFVPVAPGFGWLGTPYVYNIPTQYFHFRHCQRISALKLVDPATERPIVDCGATYIDDGMVVGPVALVTVELEQASACIRSTFSSDPNAVNSMKTVMQPRAVRLGVLSDIDTEMAAPCWKAYLKLCYAFYHSIPYRIVGARLTVRQLQSLAGLSLRYSRYIHLLRQCAFSMFRCIRGHRNKNTLITLSVRVTHDILLWRTVLKSAYFDARLLQTPFNNVIYNDAEFMHTASNNADLCVFCDAASTPNAIGIFIPGVAYLSYVWPHPSSEPIATFELLGAVLAYFMAVSLCPCRHIHVYIDNQNAIACATGRCRSDNQFALHLVTLNCYLQALHPHTVQTRSYVNTQDNPVADGISRLRFNNPLLAGLPRYELSEQLADFLIALSSSSPVVPFQTLLTQHTLALGGSFLRI